MVCGGTRARTDTEKMLDLGGAQINESRALEYGASREGLGVGGLVV